jgi:hypothetical protein
MGDSRGADTAAHAGGKWGERDLPLALGKLGQKLIITSVGPGGHRLTDKGFDAISYGNHEVWLLDNKASGSVDNVDGNRVTSLGKNLLRVSRSSFGSGSLLKIKVVSPCP